MQPQRQPGDRESGSTCNGGSHSNPIGSGSSRAPRVCRGSPASRLHEPLLTAERARQVGQMDPREERVLTRAQWRRRPSLDPFGWTAAGEAFFDRDNEDQEGGEFCRVSRAPHGC